MARIRLSCGEARDTGPAGQELQRRVAEREREAKQLLASMNFTQRSDVRLARALFLQLLLESAAQRLQGWSDQDPLDRMPPSRLFEWTSHDHEQLELAQLESQMTPEEVARYVSALHAH